MHSNFLVLYRSFLMHNLSLTNNHLIVKSSLEDIARSMYILTSGYSIFCVLKNVLDMNLSIFFYVYKLSLHLLNQTLQFGYIVVNAFRLILLSIFEIATLTLLTLQYHFLIIILYSNQSWPTISSNLFLFFVGIALIPKLKKNRTTKIV